MATIDERTRHELYLSIEDLIGAEKAETLMSMLPPVGWADVATKQDLAALKSELSTELAVVKSDLGADMAVLRSDFRADLNEGLRNQMRVLIFSLLGALFTMMSLNLTAIALLR
ncbi:MAG: hypothetical protein ABIV94_03700 [Acidimicrobiales bacterium]